MAPPINEEEEFRGRISVKVEHIYERLADIEAQIADLRSLVVARLDAHERYHRENEHRWGVIAWCHRYPFRLVAVVASLAVALIADLRNPLIGWLLELVRKAAL